MQAGDIINTALWRTRQHGTNFGGAPANTPNDFTPPAGAFLLLNNGYAEFIDALAADGYKVAPLVVTFPTSGANTVAGQSISLNPIPPNGATVNPAALRIWEMTYTQAGGVERYIPIVSTDRFRGLSGGYIARFGNYSSFPRAASTEFGLPTLQLIPGLGVNGDTIKLTITPDILNAPAGLAAAQGGQLVNNTDVPLIRPSFHPALVDYLIMQFADAQANPGQIKNAQDRWLGYIANAKAVLSTFNEGDPEQRTVDPMLQNFDPATSLPG